MTLDLDFSIYGILVLNHPRLVRFLFAQKFELFLDLLHQNIVLSFQCQFEKKQPDLLEYSSKLWNFFIMEHSVENVCRRECPERQEQGQASVHLVFHTNILVCPFLYVKVDYLSTL